MADPEVRVSGIAVAEDLTGDDVEMASAEVTEVIEIDTATADGEDAANGTAEGDETRQPEARLTFVECNPLTLAQFRPRSDIAETVT